MTLELKKMNAPLVSIVVPCYNVEKFITKGLESVFKQTYKHWECIIINDGSTDNTESEIEKWTKQDQRFTLITQQNKGLSGARNTGLKNVNGDCILFFDPDDLLDENCLKSLTDLYQPEIDVVMGKSAEVYNQTTSILKTLEHYTITDKTLSDINFIELSIETPFSVVAWNKLYNSEFIFSNNLTFEDGIVHEDELWFFQTMYLAKTIIFNSEVTYYYNIGNQSSITKNYSLYNLKSYLTVIEKIFSNFYTPEKNQDSKIITGTYILKFQITVVSAFFRFAKKNKNITFKSEAEDLIKKHLTDFNVTDYKNKNAKELKQYKLFEDYGKINPETAFKLIRNIDKNTILKRIESIYLKYTFKDKL
ncbi:glycosyltransferase family 2 protein [Psychroserpens ponticola]|uniref:Glycosyltransferase n=1 Tax=Psychroserpens ponticola TaxID=2932268 RepID=A0ABY7S0Y0_9FLAO|nr:glycosyltransferase [Psychroserpens ponticola]WCO02982.1 glycosyltransferase [Psychroserpens ponticola]